VKGKADKDIINALISEELVDFMRQFVLQIGRERLGGDWGSCCCYTRCALGRKPVSYITVHISKTYCRILQESLKNLYHYVVL
jgi:hypothetical protein